MSGIIREKTAEYAVYYPVFGSFADKQIKEEIYAKQLPLF